MEPDDIDLDGVGFEEQPAPATPEVDLSRPLSDANAVLVSGIPAGAARAYVKAVAERCGHMPLANDIRQDQDFGFLVFESPAAVEAAVAALDGAAAVPAVTPGVNPFAPATDPALRPTSHVLVLKNLPYTVSEESVGVVLMQLGGNVRVVSYELHVNPQGQFVGMVDVTFNSAVAAGAAFKVLNGRVWANRRLRVEFKRNNTRAGRGLSERPPPMTEEVMDKELYEQLQLFKGSDRLQEITFPESLSMQDRRNVHFVAELLGLSHESVGSGAHRQIVVAKLPDGFVPTHATPRFGTSPLDADSQMRPRRGSGAHSKGGRSGSYSGAGSYHQGSQGASWQPNWAPDYATGSVGSVEHSWLGSVDSQPGAVGTTQFYHPQ